MTATTALRGATGWFAALSSRLSAAWGDPDMAAVRRALHGRQLRWWSLLALQVLLIPLSLADAFALKFFFDNILVQGERALLLPFMALLSSIVLFTLVMGAWFNYGAVCLGQRWDVSAKTKMVDCLLYKPFDFFMQLRSGDVLFRLLNDTAVVPHYLTGLRYAIITNLLVLPLVIGLMIYWDPFLALVALCFVPVQILVLYWLGKKIRLQREQLRARDQALLSTAENVFSEMESIKSFGLEGLAGKDWIAAYRRRQRLELDLAVNERVLGGSAMAAAGLGSIIVLGLGTSAVLGGRLSIGELMAFLTFSGRLSAPCQQIASYYLARLDVVVAVKRMKATWQSCERQAKEFLVWSPAPEPAQSAEPPGRKPWRIVLDDVTYRWGPKPLIANVTLEIKPGCLIRLRGQNGAGKTTLLRVVSGLLTPTQGALNVYNHGPEPLDPSWLRKNVIYLSPHSMWIQDSLERNLLLAVKNPGENTAAEINQWLRLTRCDFLDELPLGLNTPVAANGSNFSTGELQRLCLVRALLCRPKLLILDEALGSVAAPERLQIISDLRSTLGDDVSILYVEHQSSETAGSTLDMARGRIGRAQGRELP